MNTGEPERVPPAFQISRQLDQEKMNFLTKRIEELLRSNNELRSGASQNEKDTHDIVLYFQREMEIKDDIILRLNEELVKCQTQLKFEVERIKKQYETELNELKYTSEHTITTLQTKLTSLESDLKSVELYKREKDLHEEAIRKLEKSMQQQREQLIDAMEEQERRFLEEKAQIFKELDEQKAAFREVALSEARLAMSEEAKKILADNNRMFEELKFHHAEAVQFQAEKALITTELTTTKRELSLLAEKEIEYAKQAHNRSKEIKALRERVDQLEKQQAGSIEKFKTRAKELKATVTKELEEATLDAAGLRRLLHIKNKELKHMKSLAATILSQRTETEQFFLEAMQEVKEVIRQERKQQQQQQQALLIASGHQPLQQSSAAAKKPVNVAGGTSFPPLTIKPANVHLMEPRRTKPSEITFNNLEKVKNIIAPVFKILI
jgi:myosin heavy subunit